MIQYIQREYKIYAQIQCSNYTVDFGGAHFFYKGGGGGKWCSCACDGLTEIHKSYKCMHYLLYASTIQAESLYRIYPIITYRHKLIGETTNTHPHIVYKPSIRLSLSSQEQRFKLLVRLQKNSIIPPFNLGIRHRESRRPP